MITREQVEAYGVYWEFTVYANGVRAQLVKEGKNIGYGLLFVSWEALIGAIEPVSFVRVFVRAEPDIYFMARDRG